MPCWRSRVDKLVEKLGMVPAFALLQEPLLVVCRRKAPWVGSEVCCDAGG